MPVRGGSRVRSKRAADLEELLAARDGAVEAAGAGDDPEILIFDLERHRAAA